MKTVPKVPTLLPCLLWLSYPKALGTKKSLADSQSTQIGMLAQMMKQELGSAQASTPVKIPHNPEEIFRKKAKSSN